MSAGCLQTELHHLSGAHTALAAENMQMQHEMEHTVSLQRELALSRQVSANPAADACHVLLPAVAARAYCFRTCCHDCVHTHFQREDLRATLDCASLHCALAGPRLLESFASDLQTNVPPWLHVHAHGAHHFAPHAPQQQHAHMLLYLSLRRGVWPGSWRAQSWLWKGRPCS